MVWMKWDIVMENCEFVSVKKQNIKMRKKMKDTFNEKDLFDLFISPLNPDFQTPSLMDGYVYATDGLRLIKIKADTLNGDYEPNGRLNEMMSKYRWPDNNCNCHITKEHIRQALASAPQKEELINVDCPECIGTGVIRCEYIDKAGKRHEVEAECPVCNGEGFESKNTRRIIACPSATIILSNSKLRARDLQIHLMRWRTWECTRRISLHKPRMKSFSESTRT